MFNFNSDIVFTCIIYSLALIMPLLMIKGLKDMEKETFKRLEEENCLKTPNS